MSVFFAVGLTPQFGNSADSAARRALLAAHSHLRKLAVIQRRVEATAPQKLVVVALFDDVAVFHDEYYVRIAYRGKTVRNDKASAAFHHACKPVLNFQLRACVDRGSRLVENEHRRQAKHYSSDTEELFLPL